MKRISEKISCFYSRDYQIPDQPKFSRLNLKTDPEHQVIRITFKDNWAVVQPMIPEKTSTEGENLELKQGNFELQTEEAINADGIDVEGEQKESDDDNLSVYTQIQLQKEPNKSILKATCPGETAEDRERWAAAIKLLTFFGLNFEKSSEYLTQTSSLA